MDVRYRLDHESALCEHYEKQIVRDDGSTHMEVDQMITPGLMVDVIRPSDGDDPHAAIYFHDQGTLTIEDQCGDGECVALIIRTGKLETTIYLPSEMTLTTLDAAICSAIMEWRGRDERHD